MGWTHLLFLFLARFSIVDYLFGCIRSIHLMIHSGVIYLGVNYVKDNYIIHLDRYLWGHFVNNRGF